MIRIDDKTLCCGCTACVSSCPVQCIVMRRDREGFDYPVANPDLCIGCGKCERVCPVINPADERSPKAVYAAFSDRFRGGSSSGGIFPAIAHEFISAGGVVYGAALNRDMTVGHTEADSVDSLRHLLGSKYVQSDLYSVFEEVRDLLNEGRKVLFSGTPCQIAGLKSFLGDNSEGLSTVDVACHGVPSPGLWEKYVNALEIRYKGKLARVDFRDKSISWRHYCFNVEIEDGKSFSMPFIKDPFMALFIQNMSLRPSCYNCHAKNGRSGSDLTLADFWGCMDVMPDKDDDRGISLVHVNTDRGQKLLESSDFNIFRTDPSVSGIRNDGFKSRIKIPEQRSEFFKGVHSAPDLIGYMSGYVVVKPWYKVLHSRLLAFWSDVKKRLRK